MLTRSRLQEQKDKAASFRLRFEPVQICVKLIFPDALPTLQFGDAFANLGVNCLAIR